MTDAVITALTENKELVITSDNSGAIGEKDHDEVHVPNHVVSYYACRVAFMDLITARGIPHAIVMQNFTGEQAWSDYVKGVQACLENTPFHQIPITGSTESNFPLTQSGLGLTIIGTKTTSSKRKRLQGNEKFAVIGTPLVGNEVIEQENKIAPIKLFLQLTQMNEVVDVQPVGSKGIQSEWAIWTKRTDQLASKLAIEKSGGPATSFLIAYHQNNEQQIKKIAGEYFHELYICK